MKGNNRALIIATVPIFFIHMITVSKVLNDLGFIVDAATNFDISSTADFSAYHKCHNISFSRSPISNNNIHAYVQLRKLLDSEQYDLVFCNTPVGGVIGRLATRKGLSNSCSTIYMAHGFHFFDGAPFINWLLYYPVEWLCSWITETLITITLEDYSRAKKQFHAKRTEYVPGVGVDLSRFADEKHDSSARRELGIADSDLLILSVGELNRNKNHQVIIRALSYLDASAHYVVAGEGNESSALCLLAKECGVQDRVHLLGSRQDVPRLMSAANIYVLPSLREGLNVSLMEAMASGLPCVCRCIRGNTDLIENDVGGQLVKVENPSEWAKAITRAQNMNSNEVRTANRNKVKRYSREAVAEALRNILSEYK